MEPLSGARGRVFRYLDPMNLIPFAGEMQQVGPGAESEVQNPPVSFTIEKSGRQAHQRIIRIPKIVFSRCVKGLPHPTVYMGRDVRCSMLSFHGSSLLFDRIFGLLQHAGKVGLYDKPIGFRAASTISIGVGHADKRASECRISCRVNPSANRVAVRVDKNYVNARSPTPLTQADVDCGNRHRRRLQDSR